MPREYNCTLIENNLNFRNLRASKAVGEPPLLLSLSVWAAVKDALRYAIDGPSVHLKIPATQEHVYMHLKGAPE